MLRETSSFVLVFFGLTSYFLSLCFHRDHFSYPWTQSVIGIGLLIFIQLELIELMAYPGVDRSSWDRISSHLLCEYV